MNHWMRAAILLLLVGGMGSALVACGGVGGNPAAANVRSPLLPTATTAPLPTTTSIPTITPTLTSYAPPCLATHLQLAALPNGPAASGHGAVIFQFTNVGASACSLHGFPSAHLLDAAGNILPVKVIQASSAYLWAAILVNTIQLAPKGMAYFMAQMDTEAQNGQPCAMVSKTLIYPPQSATDFSGFVSPRNLGSCDGMLYLSPVVARVSDLSAP